MKPKLEIIKVTSVQVPNYDYLTAVSGLGWAEGQSNICVTKDSLEGFEDENKEIQAFMREVYENAKTGDIMFYNY